MSNVDPISWLPLIAVIGVPLVLLFLAKISTNARIKIGGSTFHFNNEANEVYDRLPEAGAPPSDKQYALLKEYHSKSLAQSTQIFWFSLISATLGFAVILYAAIVAVRTGEGGLKVASLQLLSGTIVEAVSTLFFVESNRSRKLLAEFFDKLREDRKFEESLLLARQLSDPTVAVRLHSALSINFARVPEGQLPTILDGLGLPMPAGAAQQDGRVSTDLPMKSTQEVDQDPRSS